MVYLFFKGEMMRSMQFIKTILYLFVGYFLFSMNAYLQADDRVDDQVRFSTESNLLTIPLAIINQHQIVFNAEMQLLSNGNFVLTKYSEQPPVQINLDEPFILEMDKMVWFKSTDFRLKLVAVTEDSRCPVEADCIQAGTVSVVLAIYQGVDHLFDYLLLIDPANVNDAHRDIGNFRIKLLKVDPIPSLVKSSKSADYRATFVINSLVN